MVGHVLNVGHFLYHEQRELTFSITRRKSTRNKKKGDVTLFGYNLYGFMPWLKK